MTRATTSNLQDPLLMTCSHSTHGVALVGERLVAVIEERVEQGVRALQALNDEVVGASWLSAACNTADRTRQHLVEDWLPEGRRRRPC